jgi:hypothetical protein
MRARWSWMMLLSCACSDPSPPRIPVVATVSESEVGRFGVPLTRSTRDDATEEQLTRRARSIARLRAEGVPVLDELPVIERADACHFRTTAEIVDRAVALLVVASRGAGDPPDYVAELATRFVTAGRYSPVERAFMADAAPTPEMRSALSWRFEALLVLAWALGYRETLPSPTSPTDGVEVAQIFRDRSLAELVAGARPRSPAELLDLADLLYRYHWAIVDAGIAGRTPPAGLSADVIMEWHQAINWLIGYQGASWDDVPTDT